jgi:hypothetical protein
VRSSRSRFETWIFRWTFWLELLLIRNSTFEVGRFWIWVEGKIFLSYALDLNWWFSAHLIHHPTFRFSTTHRAANQKLTIFMLGLETRIFIKSFELWQNSIFQVVITAESNFKSVVSNLSGREKITLKRFGSESKVFCAGWKLWYGVQIQTIIKDIALFKWKDGILDWNLKLAFTQEGRGGKLSNYIANTELQQFTYQLQATSYQITAGTYSDKAISVEMSKYIDRK